MAEFNHDITSRMLDVALEKARSLDIEIADVSRVPGCYDMPLVVDALLARENIDAVATLGCIIRGQTRHDEIIAHAVAGSLAEISTRRAKPVSLGISGPGMQKRHALARIRPVAERAVEAALELFLEQKRITGGGSERSK